MKKNQNMVVWLSKMVLTQHFGECVEAGKGRIKPVHLREKSVTSS
jgi:hypothetical protein